MEARLPTPSAEQAALVAARRRDDAVARLADAATVFLTRLVERVDEREAEGPPDDADGVGPVE
jgi:hypothetical protein